MIPNKSNHKLIPINTNIIAVLKIQLFVKYLCENNCWFIIVSFSSTNHAWTDAVAGYCLRNNAASLQPLLIFFFSK
jgi:hypothetical protein